MANLWMIDSTRPFMLTAFSRGQVTDATITRLASSMNMPELLNIDEPTVGAVPLSIDEAENFIAWLLSTHWGERLEEDLQCMSEDKEGRPFLTSWLGASEFEQLVRDARGSAFGERLQEAFTAWSALGVDTVYLEGYQLSRSDNHC